MKAALRSKKAESRGVCFQAARALCFPALFQAFLTESARKQFRCLFSSRTSPTVSIPYFLSSTMKGEHTRHSRDIKAAQNSSTRLTVPFYSAPLKERQIFPHQWILLLELTMPSPSSYSNRSWEGYKVPSNLGCNTHKKSTPAIRSHPAVSFKTQHHIIFQDWGGLLCLKPGHLQNYYIGKPCVLQACFCKVTYKC